MHRLPMLALACLLLFAATGCGLLAPLPDDTTLQQRVNMLPTYGKGLDGPVTIRFNDAQVPFIEATTDADAAYALGVVHAHLRLAQMAVAKRIAAGRVSEMAGPFTEELDGALRAVGFGRAVPQMVQRLDPANRAWLQRFADGVNDCARHLQTTDQLPFEYTFLDMELEPWTVADSLLVGRLAGTDVNWIAIFRVLGLPPEKREQAWEMLTRYGTSGATSLGLLPQAKGSNAWAVSASRSTSGGALLASDPHLGLVLPNFWLAAGVRAPSLVAVGLMGPGLPAFAVGRNEHIAWGGTNMRALGSEVVDVTDLPAQEFSTERHHIDMRWLGGDTVTNRLSPYGPVVSDAEAIGYDGENGGAPEDRDLALRWVGHAPTSEFACLMAANRARTFDEFVAAFETADGFAVPAQNMVYADDAGRAGLVLTGLIPQWPEDAPNGPRGPVSSPSESDAHWATLRSTADLPRTVTHDGYVASANNRPADGVTVGYLFPPDGRIRRLHQLLEAGTFSLQDFKYFQMDTYSLTACELARQLADAWTTLRDDAPPAVLTEWDCRYSVDSLGAYRFEVLLTALAPVLFEQTGNADFYELAEGGALIRQATQDVLAETREAGNTQAIGAALDAGAAALANANPQTTWGDVHYIRVAHALSQMPVVGGRFPSRKMPAGGSHEVLMKAAHPFTAEEHRAYYGSQSRFVADMADPDATWFCLMGGQDGRLNSSTFDDQTRRWQAGRYLQLPLTPQGVQERYTRKVVLSPVP